MLQHEPEFRAAYAELQSFFTYVGSDPQEVVLFLAHNAPFDLRVMRKALAKENISFPGNWIFHQNNQGAPPQSPQLRPWKAGGHLPLCE